MILKCLDNPNNQTVDVVIATVPWTDTSMPLMAPAALKPSIERAGMTSLCVDLNIEVYNLTLAHPKLSSLIEFFFDGRGHPDVNDWLEDLLTSTASQILSWQPKYVGFSLFSYVSRNSCRWLCYYIKKLSPDTKIILGGPGCLEQFTGPSFFVDELLSLGLVDYHIRGDGENALYQLLTGNDQYPGINSPVWKEITKDELLDLPFPNYDDYDFLQYENTTIGIQGSRGCVRSCTFCDYIANWTKFHWRTGENIFDEMMTQYKKYGIRRFKFQDALINGNLKEFNNLIKLLAEYNNANPEEKFSWGGFYIFREQSVSDNEMWNNIAQSGAEVLTVGIENLNEDIRYHIGKKFSNASIDYHLAQAKKHKIKLLLLFIVGYVTEKVEHIEFAKKWLVDHVEYIDLLTIHWGGTLGIFPNTYLDANKDKLSIKVTGPQPNLWISTDNGSNPTMRAQWVNELVEKSKLLGYNVMEQVDNHFILEKMLNESPIKS